MNREQAAREAPAKNAGLLHIYTGEGKGKTTASVGLCIRARGAGLRVLFAQFLKGRPSAEVEMLRAAGVEVRRTDPVTKFLRAMSVQERAQCEACCKELFAYAAAALREGTFDLVVLDEVLDVVNHQIMTQEALCQALRERAPGVEAVLTGRTPGEDLCAMADYISRIEAVKHPFDRGIAARRGIEY